MKDLTSLKNRLEKKAIAARGDESAPGVFLSVYKNGDFVGRHNVASGTIFKIGKLSSSLIVTDAEDCARMHAVIERNDEGLHIIDLGSTTGTLLNGHEVKKRDLLKIGDFVGIGKSYVIQVEALSHDELPECVNRFKAGDLVQICIAQEGVEKTKLVGTVKSVVPKKKLDEPRYMIETFSGTALYFESELRVPDSEHVDLRPCSVPLGGRHKASVSVTGDAIVFGLEVADAPGDEWDSNEKAIKARINRKRAISLIAALTAAVERIDRRYQ